jgi:hypothetical protein
MNDLSLIRDLAAYAIEFEFGVKSSATIYRDHLYELQGFHSIFGESLSQRLKASKIVDLEEVPSIPPLHVGLWGEEDYPPLRNLTAQAVAIKEGLVYLECASVTGRTRMLLGLDFARERLLVDTIGFLVSVDDGTETAARDAIAVESFRKAYFSNGELVVKRADTGQLMGRCDAFIPVNVDMAKTLRSFQASIERMTEIAEERAANSPK